MTVKNYFAGEISCRCGCGADNVDDLLIERLNRTRDYYGKAIQTTSICRCPEHNKNSGGVADSAHISTPEKPCYAADLYAKDSRDKLNLAKAALLAGFNRIIFYPDKPTLIHVDTDLTKPEGLFLR